LKARLGGDRGMQIPPAQAPLAVWWIIWFAILGGLVTIGVVIDPAQIGAQGDQGPLAYAGVGPLVLSSILRWLVLPRIAERSKALVTFIVGAALAEGCGILGLLLGGDQREAMFLLGVFGVTQWMPLFARRYFKPAGAAGHGLR
jgi:hypothetical protein